MTDRTFFILLNLDAFSAEMAGLDSTEERGQWVEGFQVGAHGHGLRESWSEIKLQGHQFGVDSLRQAEERRTKFSEAGKRSAKVRQDMKGSAQPERRSNNDRTSFEKRSEHPLEQASEQRPEQDLEHPVTSNQEPVTKIQEPRSKKEPLRGVQGGPGGKFIPPTADEAKIYATEIGFARWETWLDHYEANGWMAGRVKMKDWRRCMAKWNREEKPAFKPPTREEYFAFCAEMAIRAIPFPEEPRYQWPEDRWKESYNRHNAYGWKGIHDWQSILKSDCQQWVSREIENRKRPAR